MAERSRKLAVFTTFAANLRLFDPTVSRNVFRCPMCRKDFTEAQIDELSDAHILPESVGGRLTTLSCTPCDGRIGRKWNRELLDFRKFLSNHDKGIYGTIVWTVDGTPLGEAPLELRPFSREPDSRITIHRRDQFFGEFRERVLQYMQETGQKQGQIRWQVKTRFAHWPLSYWHSFYLYAFHILGYQWVYSPIGQAMRQQIEDEVHPYLDQDFREPAPFPIQHCGPRDSYLSLRIIYSSQGKAGLLFTFPLPHSNEQKACLYLACPYPENDWKVLKTEACNWGPNIGWRDNNYLKYGDYW